MRTVEESFDDRMIKFKFVEKIKDSSLNASGKFEDRSIDVVYIDGDHRYEAVVQDIKKWLPKVKPGGYLAGHDYTDKYSPSKPWKYDVKRALQDNSIEPCKIFEDTSWVYKVEDK
jgi:hypothetical protein